MPKSDIESRETRDVLLAAARAEIAENGIEGTSLRAIARRAELSHQAPGHFFGSRRGMLTALVTQEMSTLRKELEATLSSMGDASARDRLTAASLSYIRLADRDSHIFRLISNGELIDLNDPNLKQERQAAWRVLTQSVSEAQAQGWRSDESPDEVAMLCWIAIHGTAMAWVDGLLSLQFPGRTLEEIGQIVVRGL